jgi:hypothetical protein
MALNKNHEFEEVAGIKCGIVEKNVKPARVDFLKDLLEYNGFTVITAPTPPPKLAAVPVPKPAAPKPLVEGEVPVETAPPPPPPPPPPSPPPPPPPPPETFTVGVTDTTFNPVNAIFGRMLKTKDGHIVTLAYWNQKESESHDDIPYFETSGS